MKNTFYNQRYLFVAAVIIGVAAISLLGLWWWLAGFSNQAESLSNDILILRTESLYRAETLRSAALATEPKAKLDNYFINQNTLAQFIEQLEIMGRESGVKLKLNQANDKEGLHLELLTEGTFSQNLNFIHLLESMPFYGQLMRVALTQIDKSWSASVSLNLISFDK
jgi:hypothetical protein